MEICKTVDKISWRPHPVAKDVSIKPLVTQNEDGLNVTCMLVKIPVGAEVPEHIHEEQADILYPLQGLAEMVVELDAFCSKFIYVRGSLSEIAVG